MKARQHKGERPEPPLVLPLVGTALVLTIAIGAGLLFQLNAPAPLPGAGTFTLRSEEAVTQWVEVPAGAQARWQWDGGGYLNFKLEARGTGVLDSDDTGAAHGCVRAAGPFAVRLAWSRSWMSSPGPDDITYSIAVEPATLPCDRMRDAGPDGPENGWGASFSKSPGWPGLFFGNMAFAALYGATWWPRRKTWSALRKRDRYLRELGVQARERWVADQVRLRRERGR